jgi:hypothetical protein
MYPGLQAAIRPEQPAVIMAQSGEAIVRRHWAASGNGNAGMSCIFGLQREKTVRPGLKDDTDCVVRNSTNNECW